MAEAYPPKLGDIPQHSEFSVPTLSSTSSAAAASAPAAPASPPAAAPASSANDSAAMSSRSRTSNGADQIQSAKNAAYSSKLAADAQSAYNTVAEHPVTQNIADTVNNAPMTQAVKNQNDKVANEFSNLANARTTPETRTATDQPLTHYHSFFYSLLSWENPRMSGLSYTAIVTFIFIARYMPILPLALKGTFYTLGATALAEVVGKAVFSQGLTSSFRPRQYYTIPRENLEALLEDVQELINFFVIESQRILFAENVYHTMAAFLAAFTGWLLVQFVPLWGLALIGVTSLYMAPLIYISNQEAIDTHISNAQDLMNSQAGQVRDLAGHHSARAAETLKQYAGDYTAKAQQMMGGAKSAAADPKTPVKGSDFPSAPRRTPSSGVKKAQAQRA